MISQCLNQIALLFALNITKYSNQVAIRRLVMVDLILAVSLPRLSTTLNRLIYLSNTQTTTFCYYNPRPKPNIPIAEKRVSLIKWQGKPIYT